MGCHACGDVPQEKDRRLGVPTLRPRLGPARHHRQADDVPEMPQRLLGPAAPDQEEGEGMTVARFADAGKMTLEEYRQRRDVIRATYGDTATERTSLFDQDLAQLYETSRWTHAELAKEEAKSEAWIERHVRFGQFLKNLHVEVLKKSLTIDSPSVGAVRSICLIRASSMRGCVASVPHSSRSGQSAAQHETPTTPQPRRSHHRSEGTPRTHPA
jgi:hypothetical protein